MGLQVLQDHKDQLVAKAQQVTLVMGLLVLPMMRIQAQLHLRLMTDSVLLLAI